MIAYTPLISHSPIFFLLSGRIESVHSGLNAVFSLSTFLFLENAICSLFYLPSFFSTFFQSSVSLLLFSTCIAIFLFLSLVFSCVTSHELSHLSALFRVAMFTRLDWLSGITWDGLTRMQLVCAFPLPLP